MVFFRELFNRKEHLRFKESKKAIQTFTAEENPVNNKNWSTFAESEEQDEQEEQLNNVDDNEEYEVVEREILPAKIICPDCGGITLEGLDFCDKCGGEL